MEKISINHLKTLYDIVSISPISTYILRVEFANEIPSTWGTLHIYTRNGQKASSLEGYDTVYRQDGNTVYLSNDGSIYTEPEDPVSPEAALPPEPYVPTLDEVKASKKIEMNRECSNTILNGVDVKFSDENIQHFTLKTEDQIAFIMCAQHVLHGVENIPWHPNGDTTMPCVFYSNKDMKLITDTVFNHISYNQTYCNSLKLWIDACETIEDVNNIHYGSEIPVTYQSEVMKSFVKTH